MILGIDPGNQGGFAWLTNGGEIVDLCPMPVEKQAGNVTKTFVIPEKVVELLRHHRITYCALEKAQAMPGQGVVSMFSYGTHYGILRGILSALKIRHTLVTPKGWMNPLHVGLPQSTKPKEKSRLTAEALFPEAALVKAGCRKQHEGLIDALLIAEWARRHWNEEVKD